jgi:hypothetical protein
MNLYPAESETTYSVADPTLFAIFKTTGKNCFLDSKATWHVSFLTESSTRDETYA